MNPLSLEHPRGLPECFQVIEEIHHGRERSLWRLRNLADGRTEVLKLVRPDGNDRSRREVVGEFLLLDRIRHPHWVRPFGFHHLVDGSVGYRMEDLPGGQPDGSGTPGWGPRDLEAVRAVLGALANLHALGYVHLDLKPAQILAGRRGTCLVDLGLAAPSGSDLPARGTWGFIAPEVLAGREWDHRADLYSLGCVLAQIWTGENPLGEGEIADQIRRQKRRPRLRLRERIEEMPEGLDRVVESLLDPNPAGRPVDAASAWEALHTMAGYRDHYLERRHLPVPDDLPFFAPEGVEELWDDALRGGRSLRWVITGPIGSGRRRLLDRLRARAEAAGGLVSLHGDRIQVQMPRARQAAAPHLVCRIGRVQPGEHVVELGRVGARTGQAALAAFNLPPEGGEEEWTWVLLRLRLTERAGKEEDKHASRRTRCAIAAAMGAALDDENRRRLAEVLVAANEEEKPPARKGGTLLARGWLRTDENGRLVLAKPPWDGEALRAIVGDQEIVAAHRRLLSRPPLDPLARAVHAIGAGDAQATRSAVPPAVDMLRQRGDLGTAMDLYRGAYDLLGSSFPEEWLSSHAHIALQDGEPARCLPLLAAVDPALPEDWRTLIEAHLENWADRRTEALEKLRPLKEGAEDPTIRRLARVKTARILALIGMHEEAMAEGLPLLIGMDAETRVSECVHLAATLLDVLSERGHAGEETEVVRRICMESSVAAGPLDRYNACMSLGSVAFRRGDFAEARRYFQIAGAAAQEMGDLLGIAIADVNIGGILYEEGRLAESEAINRRVIALCDQLGDATLASRRMLNIASILNAAGRWREALVLAREARQVFDSLGAQTDADDAVFLEAVTLVETGLLTAAARLRNDLEQRFAERPLRVYEAIYWRDRGRVARWNGLIVTAREHWRRSLTIAEEARAGDEKVRTLLEQACAELAVGEGDLAYRLLEAADEVLGVSLGGGVGVLRGFARAMRSTSAGAPDKLETALRLLQDAAGSAAGCELRPWAWRCHAAAAGVATKLGDHTAMVQALHLAEEGLHELLAAIGNEVLQESYLSLPNARLFLAWRSGDEAVIRQIPKGSSDLEVFLQ